MDGCALTIGNDRAVTRPVILSEHLRTVYILKPELIEF